MANWNTNFKIRDSLTAELYRVIDTAKDKGFTRAWVSEEANRVRARAKANAPKNTPNWVFSDPFLKFEGYREAVVNANTVFLYFQDGKFYRTNRQSDARFDTWEVLPREQWGNLTGGLFWSDSLASYN